MRRIHVVPGHRRNLFLFVDRFNSALVELPNGELDNDEHSDIQDGDTI